MSKKLFNYNCNTKQTVLSEKIIDGCSQGIFDPNSTKYPTFFNLFQLMIACRWVPEEVSIVQDKVDIKTLLNQEYDAYGKVLSQLIFMDSIQTNNTSDNVNPWITEPIVNACLEQQAEEEAIHSLSYYVLVDTLYQDPNEIYQMWRTDPMLRRKNEYIGSVYEREGKYANESDDDLIYRCQLEYFIFNKRKDLINQENYELLKQSKSEVDYIELNFKRRFESQVKMIIANQCLEGIYFYSGFPIIYSLGRLGKMLGSVNMIRFIHRDELNHTALFANIFRIIHKENKDKFTEELYDDIRKMFIQAANLEIEWGCYVTQNSIIGFNNKNISDYIMYLANDRFKILNLDKILIKPFPEISDEDPAPWIKSYRKIESSKTDFFSSTVKNYDQEGLNLNEPLLDENFDIDDIDKYLEQNS